MTTIAEHLAAWGCPHRYATDHDVLIGDLPYLVREAARSVSVAANWYHEQDAALAAMVAAGDSAAVREWADSPAFREIGRETGDEETAPEYAECVRDALTALADQMEAK